MVGCQIEDPDAVGEQMTPPVAAAVDTAVQEVLRYVTRLVGPPDSVDVATA
jgi:Ni,Fe-hydrogenase maturation factor